MNILFINGETGEVIERPLNDQELLDLDEAKELADANEAATAAKQAARESALNKLAELGLTAEEIAAL
jgi:hypothetical protein